MRKAAPLRGRKAEGAARSTSVNAKIRRCTNHPKMDRRASKQPDSDCSEVQLLVARRPLSRVGPAWWSEGKWGPAHAGRFGDLCSAFR